MSTNGEGLDYDTLPDTTPRTLDAVHTELQRTREALALESEKLRDMIALANATAKSNRANQRAIAGIQRELKAQSGTMLETKLVVDEIKALLKSKTRYSGVAADE